MLDYLSQTLDMLFILSRTETNGSQVSLLDFGASVSPVHVCVCVCVSVCGGEWLWLCNTYLLSDL